MIFRATTIQDKPYYFNITDALVSINDKLSIFIKKPGSPIVYTKSVVRGTDDKTMFETDFVMLDNRFIGYVIYIDGFYVYNDKTGLKKRITAEDNYIFVANIMRHNLDVLNEVRSPINLICGSKIFSIFKVLYASEDELFINLKQTRKPIYIDEVKLCTGIPNEKEEYYFGQAAEAGVVMLHNYRPVIMRCNGTYKELEMRDYELGVT